MNKTGKLISNSTIPDIIVDEIIGYIEGKNKKSSKQTLEFVSFLSFFSRRIYRYG